MIYGLSNAVAWLDRGGQARDRQRLSYDTSHAD